MKLTGLHILLTYRCTFRCDHCFVWGSPEQTGVFTLTRLLAALDQAHAAGTIEWIYFEGGEPFVYYPILVEGIRAATERGFQVGVVTNGYWATTPEDAGAWLRPLAGSLGSLSASTDELHYDERISAEARNVRQACEQLGIPVDWIVCDLPTAVGAEARHGEPVEGGSIMYRGRAVTTLAGKARQHPWDTFDTCPHERLDDPGRVHLDPFGNLHLCQGLVLGNLFERPLAEILGTYRPREHPVVGPLLRGGPAGLAREYELPHAETYADACHLCFSLRLALRSRFPAALRPDQMYTEAGA